MTKYLISFPSKAMFVPDDEFEQVGRDAHAVIEKAKVDGVYVFDGESVPPSLDGGSAVLELPSREEAIAWAARNAEACRFDQELRVFGFDPQS